MAENKITKDDVEKVAELSRLKLTNKETEKFAEMFTDTLTYMDSLNELDTDSTKETYQVTGLTNVFQDREAKDNTLDQKEALRNASKTKDNLFVTDAVLKR